MEARDGNPTPRLLVEISMRIRKALQKAEKEGDSYVRESPLAVNVRCQWKWVVSKGQGINWRPNLLGTLQQIFCG